MQWPKALNCFILHTSKKLSSYCKHKNQRLSSLYHKTKVVLQNECRKIAFSSVLRTTCLLSVQLSVLHKCFRKPILRH